MQVQYGDVQLELVKTNSFSQEPVYSPDGMDYLFTKYTLDVRCLFHADVMSYGDNPAAIMNAVRLSLLKPRSSLVVKQGDETILDAVAPDPAGGPFPRSCVISDVAGTSSFVVNYTVEANVKDCSGTSSPILCNRWEMDQSYSGEDLLATRTTSGRLIIQRESSTPTNLDQFRYLCMPALPKGWKRNRIRFGTSSDGLSLNYQIEDQEVYRVAPSGSVSASGTYSEIYDKTGAHAFAEIGVELKGTKDANKLDLLQAGIRIVTSRLNVGDLVENCEVREELFEPSLSVRMKAKRIPRNGKVIDDGFLVDQSNIGADIPGTESNTSYDISDRTGLLSSAIAAWKYPCDSNTSGIGPVTVLEQSSPQGGTQEPVIQVSPTAEISGSDPRWSSDQKQDLYTDYDIDVAYDSDYWTLHLPIADDVPTSDEYSSQNSRGYGFNSSVIRLAPNTQRMRVKWRGERNNDYPRSPSDKDMPDGYVPLRHHFTSEAPVLNADGLNYTYAIRGELEIAIVQAKDPTSDTLKTGQLPYATGATVDIPSEIWMTDILFP